MIWAYFYCYQLTLDAHAKCCDAQEYAEPIIIYSDKDNCVMQLNQAAKNAGIEIGHGLAQTAALCPHVNILTFDAEAEKRTLTALAHRLYPLASDIVLDDINGIAVRLDNLLQYYGSYDILWNVLTQEFNHAGIHYHYATAWGIEAAKLLAHQGINKCGYTQQDIARLLSTCLLKHSELDNKTLSTLSKVGIHNVGQLLRLPVHELGRRFSNTVIQYLTALRGETFPQVTLFRPSEHFESFILLPYEVENTAHLMRYVTQCITALEHYLRARNLLTSLLTFTISYREGQPLVFSVSAATPQSSLSSWLSLVSLKIETITLLAPAISITLHCEQFELIEEGTTDFFSNRFTTIAQKQLIGRLKAKLGDTSTYTPALGDSHIFEQQTCTNVVTEKAVEYTAVSPTFLLETPTPLTASTKICFGPVRLESGWWEQRNYKRDYFIAQTEAGVRLLVFKDENQSWWVQGVYS